MEIRIPAKYSEITLKSFIAFHQAKNDVHRLMAISGAPYSDVKQLTPQSIAYLVEKVRDIMELKTAVCVRIFRDGGIDYGMIPDLTEMSMAEHVDLSSIAADIWKDQENPKYEHLPKFLAVLYRPVSERIKDRYKIVRYDSSELYHLPVIEQITMDKVNGALLFFSVIRKKLLDASLPFLEAKMKKALKKVTKEVDEFLSSQRSGVGTTLFNSSPITM